MKSKSRSILLVLCFMLSTMTAWAQSKVVTGVVTDDQGQPLPGVAVMVPGTTSGTVTDFDGK
ncbi:MAG: carboxypeptidase-like regulatory domain-containing protein [Marinilabiliaceae bacterium]